MARSNTQSNKKDEKPKDEEVTDRGEKKDEEEAKAAEEAKKQEEKEAKEAEKQAEKETKEKEKEEVKAKAEADKNKDDDKKDKPVISSVSDAKGVYYSKQVKRDVYGVINPKGKLVRMYSKQGEYRKDVEQFEDQFGRKQSRVQKIVVGQHDYPQKAAEGFAQKLNKKEKYPRR